MKTILKKTLSFSVLIAVLVLALSISSLDAYAATKKKKKAQQPQDELLVQLTTYAETLAAMGASQEDITKAQQAVALRQYQLAEAEALAAQQAELLKAQELAQKDAAAAALAAQEAAVKSLEKSAGVIFIGDSRTVQMKDSVGLSNAAFVAENSKGYTWFKDVALNIVDPMVTKGSKIVINLGVNDPGNIDNYIALVNQKAFEWNAKGATVYYATVNPVSENPYTSPEQVDYFNSKLLPGLVGVNIIDTNAYLKMTGYTLVDGLHYNENTYKNIYNYILSRL